MNWIALIVCIILPLIGGITTSTAVQGQDDGWYKNIKKSPLNPPSFIFGPAWTLLYISMGVASYLIYEKSNNTTALTLYAMQLILNFIWTPVFFSLHNVKLALIILDILLILVIFTAVEFYKIDTVAGLLLLPYLLWLMFATYLTWYIWSRNY